MERQEFMKKIAEYKKEISEINIVDASPQGRVNYRMYAEKTEELAQFCESSAEKFETEGAIEEAKEALRRAITLYGKAGARFESCAGFFYWFDTDEEKDRRFRKYTERAVDCYLKSGNYSCAVFALQGLGEIDKAHQIVLEGRKLGVGLLPRFNQAGLIGKLNQLQKN